MTMAQQPLAAGTHYTCPMHPDVDQAKPGKCPKCGMDLLPEGTLPHVAAYVVGADALYRGRPGGAGHDRDSDAGELKIVGFPHSTLLIKARTSLKITASQPGVPSP